MSTFTRPLTAALCLAGAICATVAWTSFVYLHTWADPATPGRVVSAVLDDAEARAEVVAPLERQLTAALDDATDEIGDVVGSGASDLDQSGRVDAVLDVALADPTVRDRLATAFAPESGGLSLAAALDVIESSVAGVDPTLAARFDEIQGSAPLDLPSLSVATGWRDTAETWAWRIGAVAAALFAISFVVGDRRRTLRNLGAWAATTGIGWWLVPILLGGASRRWARGVDDTAGVVIDTYVEPIRPWAILLSIGGVALLVVSLAWRFVGVGGRSRRIDDARRTHEGHGTDPVRYAHHEPLGGTVLPDAIVDPGRVSSTPPVQRAPTAPPSSVDTTPVHGVRQTSSAATAGHGATDPSAGAGASAPTTRLGTTDDDVDVWAAYSSSARPPGAGHDSENGPGDQR